MITPTIYLDTSVIANIIHGQHKPSIHLIETIREKKWICTTSSFAWLELLDIEKDDMFVFNKLKDGYTLKWILRQRDNKDLPEKDLENISKKIRTKFTEEYKFVEFLGLKDDGWKRALDICKETNISATDCIHIATALGANCDLFVSSDNRLISLSQTLIKSVLPENALAEIEKLIKKR